MNNPNATPVETHEELDTSVIEQTGNDINNLTDAADDVSKALVTLESIAAAIESAPVLTALEAKVANATIARIDAQFELPTRSVGLESATDPRKAALEDLSSKIETFKKTIGAIIAKIIEMVQKFWEWLTLNHKKIKARLAEQEKQLGSAKGKFDIPVNGSVKALTSEAALSHDSINDVAATLHGLIPAVTDFTLDSTPFDYRQSVRHDGIGFSALKSAKHFKDFTHRDNVYTLYENIAGRSLQVIFDPDIIVKGGASKSMPYQVKLTPAETSKELPANIELDDQQVLILVQGASAVVGMVDKHFANINQSIRSLNRDERKLDKQNHSEWIVILRAYSQAIGVFIDGVFTQSLRFSAGVANLAGSYIKIATDNTVDNNA